MPSVTLSDASFFVESFNECGSLLIRQLITTTRKIWCAQIGLRTLSGAVDIFRKFKYSPSYKCDADGSNMTKHVVRDAIKFFKIHAEGKTPKTSKQDRGD